MALSDRKIVPAKLVQKEQDSTFGINPLPFYLFSSYLISRVYKVFGFNSEFDIILYGKQFKKVL